MTLWEMYKKSCKILENSGNECFKSDADNIFKHLFNKDKAGLILDKNKEITQKDEEKILNMIEKRGNHIPLQYILGTWSFMGLELKVGHGVLVPRDDTGVLVTESADFLESKTSPEIVDLCSGSGCIAIALGEILKNNPKIYGIEISKKAFKYFKENIKIHKSKVTAINEDIFTSYENFNDSSLDAVISNPPYIKTSELNQLQPEVMHEPAIALNGGEDGLCFYKKICEHWVPKLKRGGFLGFEIGAGQFEDVEKIMINKNIGSIQKIKDINKINRVIIGVKQH